MLEDAAANLAASTDAAFDDPIGDDLLRLIFIACHPVLSREARAALTLRMLGGLTTRKSRARFSCPKPTIAQRIVRAKRTLAEAQRAVRSAGGAGTRVANRVRARSDLPHLQRRLRRYGRRRLDAAGAVRRSVAARSHSGRARDATIPRCTDSSR